MSKTFCFKLPDAECDSCIQAVENVLSDTFLNHPWLKIEPFSRSAFNQTITVTVADNEHSDQEISDLLINAIKEVQPNCSEIVGQEKNIPSEKSNIRSHLIKGVIGTVVGLGIILLVLIGVVLPPVVMYLLMGGSALLTFILGAESYYQGMVKLIKAKTLTTDMLFTISTLTVIGMSIAGIFLPGTVPMMMETGLLIFGFHHIGKAVKASVKEQMVKGLSFKNRAVRQVKKWIEHNRAWEECAVENLAIGDIIQVKGGDTIPVDGVCESDNGSVFNTTKTGSTIPVVIKRGQTILSGMEVLKDIEYIDLKVTKLLENSYLARLDEKIARTNREKLSEKSLIEVTTSKILQYFIPTVLVIALVSGIIIGAVLSPGLAIQCVATVLVSACPCILGLMTPLAVKIGMVKALENGVQFKSSRTLEDASNIDVVVFDLNGTLTTGVQTVTDCIFLNHDTPAQEIFACLYAIEEGLQRPIANAIRAYAGSKLTDKFFGVETDKRDLSHHSGVKAIVNGVDYLVGNEDFLTHHGIQIPNIAFNPSQDEQIIYFIKNRVVVGYVKIKDPLREDARFTISELNRMRKKVHICTGANIEVAKRYAQALGISPENIAANRVSESDNPDDQTKTDYINELKAQGKHVAMVGDAGNDALSIAASHFGIAVNSGDEITKDNAGALIHNTSLLPVVTALTVAEETIWSVKQNLVISLVYNMTVILLACGILVAIGFALNPAIGVALMVLQMALVLLNQYRIKCQELNHLKRYEAEQNKYESNQSTYQSCFQNGLVPQPQSELDLTARSLPGYQQVVSQQGVEGPGNFPETLQLQRNPDCNMKIN